MNAAVYLAVALGVWVPACYDTTQKPQANDPAVITPDPSNAGVYPTPDEQSEAVKNSPCGKACAHLALLHCPEANRTNNGTSCTTTCTKLVDSGISEFNPQCIVQASDVPAVRLCNVRCRQP